MDNKDLIFKKNDNSLEFVGNFEEYYKQELNPWRQLDSIRSRDRKWLLLDYLKYYSPKPRNILDIGCGLGHLTMLLDELIAPTVGVDISKTCIRKARSIFPLCKFQICDIRQSFPNGKFDVIILNHILWYILPELDDIITKSREHLTDGGDLIITHSFIKDQAYGKEIIDSFSGLICYLVTKHSDKFTITGFEFNNNKEAIISLRRISG